MSTGYKTPEQRRLSKRDFSQLSVDRTVYRWFGVWIKVLKELEGQSVQYSNKKHKLGFSNHKWWKQINTNKIPKTPKFIRPDIKNLPRDINNFGNAFFDRYRHLFLEKMPIFDPRENIPEDYDTFSFPPNMPIRDRLQIVREKYKQKEVKRTSNTAEIELRGFDSEQLMKRIFHTFRLEMSTDFGTNLDLNFAVQKIMNKNFVKPQIIKIPRTGAPGSRQRSNVSKFDYNIRQTQRDRLWARRLLVNLGKGEFPRYNR